MRCEPPHHGNVHAVHDVISREKDVRVMAWTKAIPAHPIVTVAGATGAVGQEFMNVLHDLDFPAAEVRALASARSAGKKIEFAGCGQVPAGELTVQEMTPESFEGVDIALYGHTHRANVEYTQPWMINPGAAQDDCCALLEIENGKPHVKMISLGFK
jgi:aspartate-semialdehyde dehydrogenase